MNSLVGYGSDDDYDDSSEEKKTDWRGTSSNTRQSSKSVPNLQQTDTNYEEVQMDLSEESNDSKPEPKGTTSSRKSRDRDLKEREKKEDYRSRSDRDKDRRDGKSKDYRDRRDRDRDDRRDRDRDRDRRSRRSSSYDRDRRRNSRSPKRSERESRHSRSRSKSRDRDRKYSKRYDRGGNRSTQGNKFESQKSHEDDKRPNSNNENGFFLPGISGRFREQIERRKQLWQKKEAPQPEITPINGPPKKVWESTTFAQDSDGKMANKFKRLMGIKNATGSGGQGVDGLKQQEEMFSSMEQQYEVARTATHTMRGVGLGFSSFQR